MMFVDNYQEMIKLNYENIKEFCEKFNSIVESNNMTFDDKQFIKFWKTEFAMALLRDIGTDTGKEIANTMIFLCDHC